MHIQHSSATRFFAAVQIVGAAIAIVTLLMTVPTLGSEIVAWAFFIPLLLTAAIALVGGIAYWQSRLWGYYATAAVFLLQLIQISSELIVYKLSFGVGVAINLLGPEGWLSINFGSQTLLVLSPGISETSISLNVFAGFGAAVIIENARQSRRAARIDTDPGKAEDTSA